MLKGSMARLWTIAALGLAAATLMGCTTDRESDPSRTATEELLISTAADRAADALKVDMGKDKKVFIDAGNVDGTDTKYAISAIRGSLLKQGAHLVDDKKNAETIVEIRVGALSIDKHETLIGIPSFNVPIPLAGPFAFPEIALYKSEQQKGIAKFGAFSYDAKQGGVIDDPAPVYGLSHLERQVVMVLVTWTKDDVHPKDDGKF
ncbi:MAG TPA: DUF6655 family protein [Dongiaceae bacterium]|jgi:hypothetical protein